MKNLFKILILSLIFFSCSFQIQDNPFSLQIQDGPFIVYYKNGQIEGEGDYKNGKRNNEIAGVLGFQKYYRLY